jgi:hypothetical protein
MEKASTMILYIYIKLLYNRMGKTEIELKEKHGGRGS